MMKPSGKPMQKIESCPTLPSESNVSCCYCLVDLNQRPSIHEKPLKSSLKVKSQAESLRRSSVRTSTSAGVSFDTVETREYPYMLGCNPSVTRGSLPLTIAWCPTDHRVQSVDEFENAKGFTGRRSVMYLKMPNTQRERSLRQAGYTTDDLQQVLEEIETIQKSREISKNDHVSDLKKMMAEARRKKMGKKKRRGLRRVMSF